MYKHTLPVCTALLLMLLAFACGEKLPADPGLLAEDLGIGLTLGMTAEQARDISPPQDVSLLVLTGEEFAGHNPYDEREAGAELVAAIHSISTEQLGRNGAFVTDPVVSIKGFLAAEGPSRLSLFGENMADVTPVRLVALLGEPASSTSSSDGSTHLGYTFSSRELRQRNITAMFSFDPGGRCYALEISLTLLSR
jgi:hypothetical protein